jgi:ATP-binding cassette, subfamily B, bacterial MsbA
MGVLLGLTKDYRARLALGILCGFIAGLTNPLLMGSIKLVFEVVFPAPGTPTLAERLQGFALFSEHDLRDRALLDQLQNDSDPVSRLLWSRFTPGARQYLSEPNTTFPQQQAVLVEQLNRVLLDSSIYESQVFAGVELRPETRTLAGRELAEAENIRLNRLLIEDAYPEALQAKGAETIPRFLLPIFERIEPPLQRLTEGRPAWLIVLVISTVPLAMLVRGLFTYLNIYLMNWVSARAIADLRSRLFAHLMTLSATFFNRVSTGELMSRLNEIQSLHHTISQAMVVIIREPVTILGLAAFLLIMQPKLTLVALMVFPITLIPFILYARKVRTSSVAIYQKYADMGRMMHENFTGYRIVKAYNLEGKVIDEFNKTSRGAVSHFMRVLRSMEVPGPMMEFFGSIGVACLFLYIALYSGATPGGLIAFVGSIFLMYQPIKGLIRLHNQLQQTCAATQYAFSILETSNSIPEPAEPKALQASNAAIEFERVSFSFGDKPVLRDINLTVEPGQMIALVGSSGSGKTTLTNLLLRFYDPDKGAIRIGGIDIRDVALRELRSQIAIVTQETVLFNDTIENNIAVGKPGASRNEIVAAAKHAYAHEFIMDKPLGYETVAGEKGITLSGGQRQRIAIARAILKNAPILILDEATSSLDTASERAIQAALDELMQHRTTICVAHRLSTVQNADLIVVLQEGRIIETGRHADLIARAGVYKKLYELQFETSPGNDLNKLEPLTAPQG